MKPDQLKEEIETRIVVPPFFYNFAIEKYGKEWAKRNLIMSKKVKRILAQTPSKDLGDTE